VIIGGIAEAAAQNAPRENLYALSDTELKPREYLDCSVDFVLENYAETTEENQTFGITTDERDYSEHYIIPCYTADETLYFISAEITYVPYQEEFNKILELSYSDDDAVFRSQYFDFTGRVQTLDPELLEFAYDTMSTYGYVETRAEFDEVFLPYELRVISPGAYETPTLFLVGALVILAGVGVLLFDILRAKRKAAAEYAQQSE
jgi:hypothetical protein